MIEMPEGALPALGKAPEAFARELRLVAAIKPKKLSRKRAAADGPLVVDPSR